MLRLLCVGLFLLATSCAPAPPPGPVELALEWRLAGLANPESVALSADGSFLYVSQVGGEADAKDGEGFIARVSLDGRLLDQAWVRGLDAPKGIALARGVLYAADIDQLVAIDAASGALRERIVIPDAVFLNDVAIAPDGSVLIADSGGSRIYAVAGNVPSVWLQHEQLESVNGLLPEADRLVVTTMQGRLLAIDYASREITVLAEGLGDADGVAAISDNRYLVSEWPGLMHVVAADGTHQTILDARSETLYLNDFLLVGDVLYQPHWEPGALSAYRLSGAR